MSDLVILFLLFVAGGLWEQYVKYIWANQWALRGKKAFRLGYLLEVGGYAPFGLYTLHGILASNSIPRASPWQMVLGAILLALGIGLNYRAVRDLKLARWNSAHLYGASDEAGLVESGVYARVRHPSYLGQMLALAGCVLIVPSRYIVAFAVTFALYTVALHVPIEEHFLVVRLGEAYREYRKRVPAFIPRLRP